MSTVKAAPIDPPSLAATFIEAGKKAGFRVEHFGAIDGCPLIALTKRTAGPRPRIYLSTGMHGDEPAPPLALLEMLEAGVFDQRANWFLCPILNPAGLARGIRENAGGIDLNRDYKIPQSAEIRSHIAWLQSQPPFDLAFCLHEDWESQGFYLYELNPDARPTLASTMIEAVAKISVIESATLIDGREIDELGIIRPVADPLERELWPEAIYLRCHHTTLGYTLESPSAFPLSDRILIQRAAVETALAKFLKKTAL